MGISGLCADFPAVSGRSHQRPRSQTASGSFTHEEISASFSNLKEGYVVHYVFEAGLEQSISSVTDGSSSFVERL